MTATPDELLLSCDVRLYLPGDDQRWEMILCVDTRRRWKVDPDVVGALVQDDVEDLGSLARWAAETGIIRPAQVDAARRDSYRAWQQAGWTSASEMHALLGRYPALQYDEEQEVRRREEQARLRASSRPCEEYLPQWPRRALSDADAGLSDAFVTATPKPVLTLADIVTSVAAGVGPTERVRRQGRTCRVGARPSFGGLWSVRAYVIALDVDGLEPGLYAVDQDGEPPLRPVGTTLSREEVDALVVGPVRAPFDVRAVVVLSIDWKRLRERYVDPAAFASAFIELGHAAAAVDLMAKALGLMAYPQCGADDVRLAQHLEVSADATEEAIIYAVTLGVSDRGR